MKTNKINVGIVGFGKVGEHHCNWINNSKLFNLHSVFDITDTRLKCASEKFNVKCFSNLQSFLSQEEMEVVIVATPPNTHLEITIACAKAKKNIIVEKPFAMNFSEAEKMVKSAEKEKVLITGHFNRRFDGDYLTVKEILKNGILGEVFHIESRWHQFSAEWASWGTKEFKPEWRILKTYGGGMVYDYASHLGDQVCKLVERKIFAIFATTHSKIWASEVDDQFHCIIKFENGISAIIEASNNTRIQLPRWFIVGRNGTLLKETMGKDKFKITTDKEEIHISSLPANPNELYENIYNAIRNKANLLVSPSDLLLNMKLISSIFESAKIGKAVLM